MFKFSRNSIWKNSITFDKCVILIFFIINVGLYYKRFLFLIQPTYLLLFLAFVFKIFIHKKLIYKGYILAVLLFGVYAFFSTIWAVDPNLAFENSITLSKYIFISIMIISLLDKKENILFALWLLALSGLISAVYYLSFWDMSQLSASRGGFLTKQMDAELPNLNLVALIASNSFIILLYYYLQTKHKLSIILAALSFITVFVLGSRKSLIFSFVGIFFIFLKFKGMAKVKLIILSISFLGLLILLVPSEYFSFVWQRFEDLNFFAKLNTLDEGDRLRIDFLANSITYFNSHPIFGNGYYNFSALYFKSKGLAMYSHNNFVETAVGLGIIGLLLYYRLYFLILKNANWLKEKGFLYFFSFILILNLLNNFFIVVTNDRFTWLLLPILYAGALRFHSSSKANTQAKAVKFSKAVNELIKLKNNIVSE